MSEGDPAVMLVILRCAAVVLEADPNSHRYYLLYSHLKAVIQTMHTAIIDQDLICEL